MSRSNRTYSGGDIIRIWCYNLEKNEQNEVFMFFLLIVPGILLTNLETLAILDKIGLILRSRLFRTIIFFIKRYLAILRRVINSLWADIIFTNKLTRKEVIRCVEKRTKEVAKETLRQSEALKLSRSNGTALLENGRQLIE